MELEIKKKINHNYILEDYRLKYKPEELTHDGIPTLETQLKEIEEDEKNRIKLDEKEKYIKDMKMRVRFICMDKIGKNPLEQNLSFYERKRLYDEMNKYSDVPHDEIIKEFNILCQETIFQKNADYSKFKISYF